MPFDADTALTPTGDDGGGGGGGGDFAGELSDRWMVGRGPNGGYLAAVLLRALTLRVADPARAPRSLTVHYLTAPTPGPVRVITTLERVGRSLAFCSARLMQDDRLVALALGAFSPAWPGMQYCDARMPEVPPPDDLEPPEATGFVRPTYAHNYDYRLAIGDPPYSGSSRAVSGGWIRLAEPQVADAVVVAAFTDGWLPSVVPRLTDGAALPTVDLTVHFRATLPLLDATPDDHYLIVVRSQTAEEGFFEEDAEVWSRSGVLVAQSRQLALIAPL